MFKSLIPKTVRHKVKFAIKRFRYSGKGRVCPICKGESRMFSDFGHIVRHDAQCIWCGALERHRLVWLFFERRLRIGEFPPTARFLHIAPEESIESRFRAAFKGKYTTADLFAEGVDMKMDISQIELPDKTFDVVYCSHVLEHVPDDIKAMHELRRVLTDRGTAVIMVPLTIAKTFEDLSITDPEERLRVFGQRDHVRRYGPDIEQRLLAAGFQVEKLSAKDFVGPEDIIKMGLTASAGDVIFVCKRGSG